MDQQPVSKSLPEPLAKKFWLQVIAAAFVGVFSIGAAIAFRDAVILLGLALTAYLLAASFSLRRSWFSGHIYEIYAVCLAVNSHGIVKKMVRNDVQVTFAFTDDNKVVPDENEAEALTTVVPRESCDFVEGLSYVLYVKASDMTHIVGHAVLNVAG